MTDDRVRVGFVVHVMQVAGAEILITQIIDRLKQTIDPTVFCLDSTGELGQQLIEKGIPVVVFNRKLGIDKQLPFRLAKEIRARRIEVLHAHQYTAFFYSTLARLLGCWSTKILFTEHGRHYPDVVSWKRRLANRLFFSRLCDASTACCTFSGVALKQIEGFTDVSTIPNGVDVELLIPRGTASQQFELRSKLGLRDDLLYVVCVARFHPIKDHAMLLRAWSIVHSEVPQARLILVGDGAERIPMQELASALKIESSVDFFGIRHDVADIVRAADLFTLSSMSEAASLTLLEAMASECAVVVTDVGGNAEHVEHGIEGFLVPRGDHQRLGEQISYLLQHEELRLRMGKAARQRVLAHFDLRTTVAKYEELYTRWRKRGGT